MESNERKGDIVMKRSFKAISAAVAAAMTISGMAAVPCYAGTGIHVWKKPQRNGREI